MTEDYINVDSNAIAEGKTTIDAIHYVPNRVVLTFGLSFRKRIWRLLMLTLRGWCYLD